MSWMEVFKINNNIRKPLNSLIVDSTYNPIRVVTVSTTYIPERSGLYRVICVGAGGDSIVKTSGSYAYCSGGGGGGVAIKDLYLTKSSSYNITVSTTASFANQLTATAGATPTINTSTGAWGYPTGGTATGGDKNYTGQQGVYERITRTDAGASFDGGSVGVDIADLTRQRISNDTRGNQLTYGRSILNYGGGAPASDTSYVNSEGSAVKRTFTNFGLPAAVIIIPIEMED